MEWYKEGYDIDAIDYPDNYKLNKSTNMEKGIIKDCTTTGEEYMNKPEYFVTFESGTQALTFSGKFMQNIGKEVEFTSKRDKNEQLRIYWPQDSSYANKGSSGGDSTQDSIERQVALKAAVEFCKDRTELTTDSVVQASDKFINWIQKK